MASYAERRASARLFERVVIPMMEHAPLAIQNRVARSHVLPFLGELPREEMAKILWRGSIPRDDWASFDARPWQHPWLTVGNIEAFRAFNDAFLARVETQAAQVGKGTGRRYAFVGNMANNLYGRAAPLRSRGVEIDLFLHPHDRFVMSRPEWEEYAGTIPPDVVTIEQLAEAGITLPEVRGVFSPTPSGNWASLRPADLREEFAVLDFLRFGPYFAYQAILEALQVYDALLAVQVPYLAYLSRKPYLVTQMGGDIWFECSRDDLLGRLQRRAFSSASAFIISNPWSLAFARRYGMRHLVYMPLMMNEERYSPGESKLRDEWERDTGGRFFVLITSRLDFAVKGTMIALEAFARFASSNPEARLVVLSWGASRQQAEAQFARLGITNRVQVLPVSGKRRIVEYLRSADVILDQFVLGYYGASALEALGCGRPVIMRIERAQYDALVPDGAPPVCGAQNQEQVYEWLIRLHRQPAERIKIGEESRKWFVKSHGASHWGRRYQNLLLLTATNAKFRFSGTPLARSLGKSEIDYHADNLAAAPKFPNYM